MSTTTQVDSGRWKTEDGRCKEVVKASTTHDDIAECVQACRRFIPRQARYTESPRQPPLHGVERHFLAMLEGNKPCKAAQDDIWGKARPRDVRIQIYISLTLGLGAFLTFCVRSATVKRRFMLTTGRHSSCARDGKASTLLARSRTTSPRRSPTSRTPSLAGSYRYGESQRSRFWRLPG